MSILDDMIKIKDKEEVLRLVSVELSVLTEEQITKARATAAQNGTTVPEPRASLHIVWEPLSYTFKGPNGNVAHDYIPVSFGIPFDQVERVRQIGWLGIPDNKLIRVNEKVGAEAQSREWARWRLRTKDILHLDIDEQGLVTGKIGQVFSNSIGRVFRVTEGNDYFPRNVQINGEWKKADEPRSAYMRYPVEDVTDTYVQPTDVPIRLPRVVAADTTTAGTEPVSKTVDFGRLRTAFEEAGLFGTPASDFSSMVKQVNFLSRHMGDSENTLVLGTAELNGKANDGALLDYLIEKGIVTLDDEGIIR